MNREKANVLVGIREILDAVPGMDNDQVREAVKGFAPVERIMLLRTEDGSKLGLGPKGAIELFAKAVLWIEEERR